MTSKLKINEKNKKSILIVTALFAVIGAGYLIFANAATPTQTGIVSTLAGGGSAEFSLTPASGSYDLPSNIALSIYENSGTFEASTVDVKLSYDASKLDFVSVDGTGGSFSTCTENSGGSGTVSLVCTKLAGSVTGNQKIGNVVFKTRVGSGSTAVSFAANSHIYAYAATLTELWNGVTTGGTYTLKTPATGGGGTGGGGSGGTTTTPPATSNTGNSAPKTTTTGGASSTPKNVAPATGGPSPVAPTENNSQSPVGSQGTVSSEASQVVAIRVIDAKGNALSGVSVSLGTLSAVSDSNGVASFSGVVAGAYTVTAKTPDGQATAKIQVKSGVDSSTAQEFQLQVKPKNMLVYYAIIGATIAFVGVVVALVAKNIITKRKSDRAHGLLGNNTAVVFGANSPTKVQETEAIPMITPAEPKVAPITPPNTSEPAPTGLEGTLITPDNSTPKTPQV